VKIPVELQYGLLFMCYMAKNPKKRVLAQELAKEYDFTYEHVAKLMRPLIRSNLVLGKRGPNGGYVLGRPLNKITFLEIIESIRGPMVRDDYYIDINKNGECVQDLFSILSIFCGSIGDMFSKITLADYVKGKVKIL
jgi:Rrf2 family transcriptional regulator, iron-sulfur cluster assembly transcription factor